jgi:hypothetical protein
LRVVSVIPIAEVAMQPIVDERTQILQVMEHLARCVTTLATQRDASGVPRP